MGEGLANAGEKLEAKQKAVCYWGRNKTSAVVFE